MVRITEEIVRKRAEHNEGEISSLEELSLHQQDIEKIEHLDRWCRELRILYLQSNLIDKIENVSRLKKLEYLNLALNNIQFIENLEGCESLKKLDLTVNFVADIFGVEALSRLAHFEELYLTGNPCTDFEGYRKYVIATLPHLRSLDGIEIEKSERLRAIQDLPSTRLHLQRQYADYVSKKEQEVRAKAEQAAASAAASGHSTGFDGRWYTDIGGAGQGSSGGDPAASEDSKDFWNEPTDYTPETRKKVHEHLKAAKSKENPTSDEADKKAPRRLFSDDGRPLNVNEARVEFTLNEDDMRNAIVLDVSAFKHMDTSLMDVDVQTNYVRVTLKGKVFQLCLDEEVKPGLSKAERSTTTGHLVITMPKERGTVQRLAAPATAPTSEKSSRPEGRGQSRASGTASSRRLEVDPASSAGPDFANIVERKASASQFIGDSGAMAKKVSKTREVSKDFVDDPSVPPLM